MRVVPDTDQGACRRPGDEARFAADGERIDHTMHGVGCQAEGQPHHEGIQRSADSPTQQAPGSPCESYVDAQDRNEARDTVVERRLQQSVVGMRVALVYVEVRVAWVLSEHQWKGVETDAGEWPLGKHGQRCGPKGDPAGQSRSRTSFSRFQEEGLPFKVVVLGENHQVHPREFLQARERLGDRLIQFGYVEGAEDYARFLSMADIIISTAMQENFGFSIAEAVYCRTLPLLPNDLSYPELLPRKFHRDFLYHNPEDLYRKLRRLVTHHRDYDKERAELSEAFRRFDWRERSKAFDEVFEEVAGG